MDGKIIIASSPRCGTNLLQVSLAEHSSAVNGGEVLNELDTATDQDWGGSHDRSAFIAKHNLFKLLSVYRDHEDFGQFLDVGLMVYLYRRDTTAQIRSWKVAASSGMWMRGQVEPMPSFTINNSEALEHIAQADRLFLRRADLVISYEEMIADWDGTIERVLQAAKWPVMRLEMARVKLQAI